MVGGEVKRIINSTDHLSIRKGTVHTEIDTGEWVSNTRGEGEETPGHPYPFIWKE